MLGSSTHMASITVGSSKRLAMACWSNSQVSKPAAG